MSQDRTCERVREINWSGCLLTDCRTEAEMQEFVGGDVMIMGEAGVIEAIDLIGGAPPWDDKWKPRPVYRVRWRLR